MRGVPEGLPAGGVGRRTSCLLGIRSGLVLLEVALDDGGVKPPLRLWTRLRGRRSLTGLR